MNQEIRTELAKMRKYLEVKGIIKPIRPGSPEDTLESIEKTSFEKEEFKENELGF